MGFPFVMDFQAFTAAVRSCCAVVLPLVSSTASEMQLNHIEIRLIAQP